jgi:hypothetical protein
MKERAAAAGPSGPDNSGQKAKVTPGMAALLRGGNGEGKEPEATKNGEAAEDIAQRARKRMLIQGSLFVADLVVIGLVARLAFISHGQFGLIEVSLSILALAIGAWLSCLALWLK